MISYLFLDILQITLELKIELNKCEWILAINGYIYLFYFELEQYIFTVPQWFIVLSDKFKLVQLPQWKVSLIFNGNIFKVHIQSL